MAKSSAGDIVITTDVDLKGFEEGIKKLNKYQIQDKKVKLELDLENLKQQRHEIAKEMKPLQDKMNELNNTGMLKEKVMALPEWQEASAKLKPLEAELRNVGSDITLTQKKISIINDYVSKNVNLQIKEKEKVEETTKATQKQAEAQKQVTKEVEKTAIKQKQANVTNTLDSAKEKSNGLSKALSSVGKVIGGIAIAGTLLVGAIGLASSRSEIIDQSIQKIKAMVDVLIDKLVNMIEPFLPKIIPLVEKILTLIFEIAEALDRVLGPVLEGIIKAVGWILDGLGWLVEQILKLLGIDISKETSQFAKDINNASTGLKETNKQVSKLKKQLLGFDEMNILNSETGSVGALGTALVGSSNKSTTDKVKSEIEEFGDKLNKYGDYDFETGFTTNIGAIAGSIKLDETGSELVKYAKQFEVFSETARSITEKNGIITIIGRTGETIKMSREEFDRLVADLNKGVISQKNIKLWERIQKTFKDINVKRYSITQKAIAQGFKDATIEYKDGLVNVRLATGETITYTEEEFEKLKKYIIATGVEVARNIGETEAEAEETFWTMGEDGKNSADKVGKFWSMTASDIASDIATTGSNVTSSFWSMGETGKETSNNTKQNWVSAGTGIIKSFTGSSGVAGAVNGALLGVESTGVSVANNVLGAFQNLPPQIKNLFDWDWYYPELQGTGAGLGGAIAGAMVSTINSDLGVAEKSINTALGVIRSLLDGIGAGANGAVTGALLGINASKIASAKAVLKNISLPRIKLAQGGIINRVGRGIPVGSAIAGERGKEAVLPLTDSQQMSYLGREIAKNIIINLTNVTELDGRQIARSVTKVMQDTQFASNGGVI